jgi:hypothetical protein
MVWLLIKETNKRLGTEHRLHSEESVQRDQQELLSIKSTRLITLPW